MIGLRSRPKVPLLEDVAVWRPLKPVSYTRDGFSIRKGLVLMHTLLRDCKCQMPMWESVNFGGDLMEMSNVGFRVAIYPVIRGQQSTV